jgi:pimeloyl-ACP methyl ester carboxylesterase
MTAFTTRSRLLALAGVLLGLALSGCARDIPYATLKARYATPASRFMTLPDGVTVHYRDQGRADGPPIVMVHGFAANLDAWEPWAARLGNEYRIITLDLPAHGLTLVPPGYRVSTEGQVEVVDELTRALHVDRFALAGNSMGGGVAWSYALAHPDRVDALILADSVGPPSGTRRKGGPPAIFVLLGNPAGRAMLRQIDPRPLAERGLRQAYVDPGLVTPQLVDRYVDLALAPGHRALLLAAQDRPRTPVTARTLQAIHAPTLVLHGAADTVIPLAAGQALAAAIPGSRLIVYPGVGHVPMEQIPDRSAADVRDFLRGTRPDRPAAEGN